MTTNDGSGDGPVDGKNIPTTTMQVYPGFYRLFNQNGNQFGLMYCLSSGGTSTEYYGITTMVGGSTTEADAIVMKMVWLGTDTFKDLDAFRKECNALGYSVRIKATCTADW